MRLWLCLCVLIAALAVAPAFAQQMPTPYGLVPAGRAQQYAATGEQVHGVFGGREVKDGEYPFQVALLRADSLTADPQSQYQSQFCGGTLVAPTWVLTAAHCMRDNDHTLAPASFFVLTGSIDLMAGKRIAVSAVIVNDAYDPQSMDHDAALVQLSEPVDLPSIALDYAGASASAAIVLGWGMDEAGKYPRRLLESDLDVVANTQCDIGIKAIYAKDLKTAVNGLATQYRIELDAADRIGSELATGIADPLTATMLCAGLKTGKRDSCYGDSGGPLVALIDGKPLELGIVSWGEGPSDSNIKCGHADVYGVYGRVASFADWIRAHIDAAASPPPASSAGR